MRQSWFTDEGDDIVFGRYVDRVETWRSAIADGRVSAEEIRAQAARVAGLMHELEDGLTDEQHAQVTDVFVEWAVLQGLQSLFLMQEQKAGAGLPADAAAWEALETVGTRADDRPDAHGGVA